MRDNDYFTGESLSLKPCPFCGGQAQYRMRFSSKYQAYVFWVTCVDCHARSKDSFAHTDIADDGISNAACLAAARAWNKRIGGEDEADLL